MPADHGHSARDGARAGAGPGAALDRDWPAYFDAVAGLPPRDTLLRALERFERAAADAGPRVAIDVGSGSGRDTLEMLRRGWRVIAVEPEAEGHARLLRSAPREARARLTLVAAAIEHADAVGFARGARPAGVDLVNASFCLPFVRPEVFAGAWAGLVVAIRPGGRFAGQFFGERDEWSGIPGRTHHTAEQVRALLKGFEVEEFEEAEKDGKDSFGDPKHHHVFHVVARRRPPGDYAQ